MTARHEFAPQEADGVQQFIASLPRSTGQIVRVSIARFRGRRRLDIRVWYRAGSTYRPGSHGISLPLQQLKLLQQALERAGAHEEARS